MTGSVLKAAAYALGALGLLAFIFLLRPINETAVIQQRSGTEISEPYLGRTLNASGGQEIGQEFTTPGPGRLSAVGIFFPILNRDSKGSVKFELFNNDRPRRLIMRSETAVSRLSNNEGLTIWRFRPLQVTKGEKYFIRLTVNAEPGLTVFSASGDAYRGGNARLDGKRLGRDLAFQVFYRVSPAELWSRLSSDMPNLVGPLPLSIIVVALWAAVAAWLHRLLTFRPYSDA